MYSWPVVCVEPDGDAEYDDCRGIRAIGFRVASSVRTADVEQARGMIESELAAFHLERVGDEVPLVPASDDGTRYLRTLDEDTADDPLLELPACDDVEFSERYDL